MPKLSSRAQAHLRALELAIDEYAPAFQKLKSARNLGEYLAAKSDRADEEILTEPILRSGARPLETASVDARRDRPQCSSALVGGSLAPECARHGRTEGDRSLPHRSWAFRAR